jgi:hypothetical protein
MDNQRLITRAELPYRKFYSVDKAGRAKQVRTLVLALWEEIERQPKRDREKLAGGNDEGRATRHPHAATTRGYSRPEERKRETGSTIGIGCRWKIQRATA